MTNRLSSRQEHRLGRLYPDADIAGLDAAIAEIIRDGRRRLPGERRSRAVDQSAVVLIAYPDHITSPGARDLTVLAEAMHRWCGELVSHVHLLPFHPSTSDDGFSVADHSRIDERYGRWADLDAFAPFGLGFDAVVNHVSAAHPWARALVDERPEGRRIATADAGADLSRVIRPRTTPLLRPTTSRSGRVHQVWCTFSHDQWDLDYRDPQTLLAMTRLLVDYVVRGAQVLRMDAVGFIWKEPGTTCMHLPQTHEIIRLWRSVLTAVSPDVVLLTETNVPHRENISYLTTGDEAHLAYNFALPPMVLDAFARGQAAGLERIAEATRPPAPGTGFVNFLASHDGVGLRGAEEFLAPARIRALADRTVRQGGYVSYRSNGSGPVPYELNTTYLDALGAAPEPGPADLDRFVAAHAILLALPGVPAIYTGSLFGARNWPEGVRRTGVNRTINRRRFDRATLTRELARPASTAARVYGALAPLLAARRRDDAFDPAAPSVVEPVSPQVFALRRRSVRDGHEVLCLHNVSGRPADLATAFPAGRARLVYGNRADRRAGRLGPYEVRWVRTG